MPEKEYTSRRAFDPHYVRDERRRSYRLALILFGSLLLYFFFQSYVISIGMLEERSMLPTMSEGETFLVNKYIYHFRKPRRGEVVVLRTLRLDEDQYVKRVIGVPGDTLALRFGDVWLNGKRLEEPYAQGPTLPQVPPFNLGEDEYFVLGDNRMQSEDSRRFGPVREENIRGKIDPGSWFAFF